MKFNLDDNVRLSSAIFRQFSKDFFSREQISTEQCLVMLGEPGIGKSTAIKDFKILEEGQNYESPTEFLILNLNSIGSEQRLDRKLFDSEQFKAWVGGSHTLYLYLDSLDECLVRTDTVIHILLEELSRYALERLYLRVPCRTAC